MRPIIAAEPARVNPASPKSEYIEAIDTWTQTRRVADAITQRELAEMGGIQRLDGLRKTLILGLSEYYAHNPRADLASGVYAIVIMLSDNDKGSCTLGQEGIGRLLHASRQRVSMATSALSKLGLIESARHKASIRPVAPRIFFDGYNHVAWELEALLGGVTSSRTPEVSPLAGHLSRGVTSSRTPEVSPLAGHNFSKKETKEKEKKGTAIDWSGSKEAPELILAKTSEPNFNQNGQMPLNASPSERPSPHCAPPPPVEPRGLRPARDRDPFNLNPMSVAAKADARWGEDGRLLVANGFRNELLELIPDGADLQEELDAIAQWVPSYNVGIDLVKAVRSQIVRRVKDARDRAERSRAQARRPASSAPSPRVVVMDGKERFDPDAKLPRVKYNSVTGRDGNRILDEAPGATPDIVWESIIEADRLASCDSVTLGEAISYCIDWCRDKVSYLSGKGSAANAY